MSKTKQSNMERIDKASLLEVIKQAFVKLDENIFHIKRHSNNTILIYDESDNVLYDPVKPILREINDYYKLGVDLYYSTGSLKITRSLGKEVINRLNQKH